MLLSLDVAFLQYDPFRASSARPQASLSSSFYFLKYNALHSVLDIHQESDTVLGCSIGSRSLGLPRWGTVLTCFLKLKMACPNALTLTEKKGPAQPCGKVLGW